VKNQGTIGKNPTSLNRKKKHSFKSQVARFTKTSTWYACLYYHGTRPSDRV